MAFNSKFTNQQFDILFHTHTCTNNNHLVVSKVGDALKSSSDDFKAKYQHDKPSSDQEVIFHCKLGGRAQRAADQAAALGFSK